MLFVLSVFYFFYRDRDYTRSFFSGKLILAAAGPIADNLFFEQVEIVSGKLILETVGPADLLLEKLISTSVGLCKLMTLKLLFTSSLRPYIAKSLPSILVILYLLCIASILVHLYQHNIKKNQHEKPKRLTRRKTITSKQNILVVSMGAKLTISARQHAASLTEKFEFFILVDETKSILSSFCNDTLRFQANLISGQRITRKHANGWF